MSLAKYTQGLRKWLSEEEFLFCKHEDLNSNPPAPGQKLPCCSLKGAHGELQV